MHYFMTFHTRNSPIRSDEGLALRFVIILRW